MQKEIIDQNKKEKELIVKDRMIISDGSMGLPPDLKHYVRTKRVLRSPMLAMLRLISLKSLRAITRRGATLYVTSPYGECVNIIRVE